MDTHEVVLLSSDDEEVEKDEVMPFVVATMPIKRSDSMDLESEDPSAIVEIHDEIHEEKVNGKVSASTEQKENQNGKAGTSEPPEKKRKVTTTKVETSSAAKSASGSPQRKSRLSVAADENKLIFEQLLSKCEEIENTAEMRKGTSKARRHFEAAQIEYRASKEFKSTIEKNLTLVTKDCLWGHLGELVKQFKLYKEREGDLTGSQKEKDLMKEKLASKNKERYYEVLKSEEHERTVRKLTRILKKLHKRILKLGTQEVDFDDDEDSAYIMEERYKARAAKVYAKLCEYTNYPRHAERMTKCKISFNGTSIPEVNKCIERFVNSNSTFPDYHDVLKLITTVNTKENLKMSVDEMQIMAGKAFRDIGKEIQRRRQWDVEDSLYAHLDQGDVSSHSQYDNDPELQEKLEENGKIFVKKFNEIVEEYTQKQNERGAEAEEENSVHSDENGASTENDGEDEEEEEDDDCGEDGHDVFQESDLGEENPDSGEDNPDSDEDNPDSDEDNRGCVEDNRDCVEDKPDCVEDKPDCIEDKPDCIEDKPDCIEDKPGGVEDKPDCVEDKPDCVEDKPDCVEDKLDCVEDKPDGVEDKPDCVEDKPDCVDDNPDCGEDSPDIVEDSPDIVEDIPDIVEDSPDIVEDSPDIVEEKCSSSADEDERKLTKAEAGETKENDVETDSEVANQKEEKEGVLEEITDSPNQETSTVD